MAVLELHCSGQAFSNWEEQGLLSGCSAWAFHCRGFSRCRSQALGARALRAEARGLSCHATRGIFPDQGSNLSPALADRFSTTGPWGKPQILFLTGKHWASDADDLALRLL